MLFRRKKSNEIKPREDIVFMVLRGKEFVRPKPIIIETPELRAFKSSIPVIFKPLIPGEEKKENDSNK